MSKTVFKKLVLPNGVALPNRVAKAAMDEGMAVGNHLPGDRMYKLYETWSKGGTGLLITGNVMVDHRCMTGPGSPALEKSSPIAPFKKWAKAAQHNDTHVWMQINHPGRQVYAALGGLVRSPSDVALDMGKHSNLFSKPVPMTQSDIHDVVKRFVTTSVMAVEAGFNGVQVHAAHGYLLSQFLSPLTNKRTDQWGGSLENRARLLYDIVKAIKLNVPKSFAVSVKLNSADFQRGGFDADDAKAVVLGLSKLNVDLVELSGGSYESPAMQGETADGRTLAREAYFLEFAKDIAKDAAVPIMTTGGITRLEVANRVLNEGVDMVGMGRALSFSPKLPSLWKLYPEAKANLPSVTWKNKTMASLADLAIAKRQLHLMGKGKQPKLKVSALYTLIMDQIDHHKRIRAYRKRYAN